MSKFRDAQDRYIQAKSDNEAISALAGMIDVVHEAIALQPPSVEIQATKDESYIRLNITKNSKGYSHESTVSFRWSGDLDTEEVRTNVALLNRMADAMAREEIREREERDRWSDDAVTELISGINGKQS